MTHYQIGNELFPKPVITYSSIAYICHRELNSEWLEILRDLVNHFEKRCLIYELLFKIIIGQGSSEENINN